MWPILIFALLVLLVPTASAFIAPWGIDKALTASFAGQVAVVDGTRLPASTLQVLYRSPTMREKYGCNATWLCRTPKGDYLLAIAQGERTRRKLEITWVWRWLTEERARQSLMHDPEAYRAAFGG